MSRLVTRLVVNVGARRGALLHELERWGARAAEGYEPADGDPESWSELPRHGTQLARVTEQLRALALLVDVGPWESEDATTRIERAQAARQQVHAIHTLWDFFRDKISLRDGPHARVLNVADDFAWRCLEPALRAGTRPTEGGPVTPPLVFFDEDEAPFARLRGTGVHVPRDVYGHLGGPLRHAASHLPVPLIGLPWRDVGHVPSFVHLAHEVGHVIEGEFALLPLLQAAMREALSERADAWSAWTGELFADAWAVLCCGEAFIAMLALEALGARGVIRNEQATDSPLYPPRALRIEVADALRAELSYPGGETLSEWRGTYGSANHGGPFDDDIRAVVRVLLDTPTVTEVFGSELRTLIDWPSSADGRIGVLLDNFAGSAADLSGDPISTAVLACALASRDGRSVSGHVVRAFSGRPVVSRAGGPPRARSSALEEAEMRARAAMDQSRTRELADLLGLLEQEETPDE